MVSARRAQEETWTRHTFFSSCSLFLPTTSTARGLQKVQCEQLTGLTNQPNPFFFRQKTSTKPCRNSDQLTLSSRLNTNILISIMKTSLLSCTSLGQRPLVWQINVHLQLPVHNPHICTSTDGNISAVNRRNFEDVLSLDFNSLSQGQHSYVSAARAKKTLVQRN